jgi:hypothetical protein
MTQRRQPQLITIPLRHNHRPTAQRSISGDIGANSSAMQEEAGSRVLVINPAATVAMNFGAGGRTGGSGWPQEHSNKSIPVRPGKATVEPPDGSRPCLGPATPAKSILRHGSGAGTTNLNKRANRLFCTWDVSPPSSSMKKSFCCWCNAASCRRPASLPRKPQGEMPLMQAAKTTRPTTWPPLNYVDVDSVTRPPGRPGGGASSALGLIPGGFCGSRGLAAAQPS